MNITSIVLASRNAKKAREFGDLLGGLNITLRSLSEFPEFPDVEETGTTFAENARLKASQTAIATNHWALSDDSGIAVDALDGAPGVYSARYAGPGCTDADNNTKLLAALKNVPPEKRGARFVCNLALADASGEIQLQVEDHCRGVVVEELRGDEGFGYDPLFLIPEYDRTFGQLGLAVKSFISHRARAFRKFVAALKRLG